MQIAEKVKVKYKFQDSCLHDFYECSNCKDDYIIKGFKYCPNCGKEIDWEARNDN